MLSYLRSVKSSFAVDGFLTRHQPFMLNVTMASCRVAVSLATSRCHGNAGFIISLSPITQYEALLWQLAISAWRFDDCSYFPMQSGKFVSSGTRKPFSCRHETSRKNATMECRRLWWAGHAARMRKIGNSDNCGGENLQELPTINQDADGFWAWLNLHFSVRGLEKLD